MPSRVITRHIRIWLSLFAALLLLGATAAAASDDAPAAAASPSALRPPAPSRPAPLIPLYISYAALQGLDVHSTYRVLNDGGREANPALAGIVHAPAALVALKAASVAGSIAACERLRRKHPAAAVLLMVGLNAAYATVVAHNYSVDARAPRPR